MYSSPLAPRRSPLQWAPCCFLFNVSMEVETLEGSFFTERRFSPHPSAARSEPLAGAEVGRDQAYSTGITPSAHPSLARAAPPADHGHPGLPTCVFPAQVVHERDRGAARGRVGRMAEYSTQHQPTTTAFIANSINDWSLGATLRTAGSITVDQPRIPFLGNAPHPSAGQAWLWRAALPSRLLTSARQGDAGAARARPVPAMKPSRVSGRYRRRLSRLRTRASSRSRATKAKSARLRLTCAHTPSTGLRAGE